MPACLYVLAHGAGAGMRHPFLERLAGGSGRPRGGNVALPVSVYGAQAAAARPAGRGGRGGARGGGRGGAGGARTCRSRRREVVRRPDDLHRAGRSSRCPAFAGLAFLGFPLHPPGQARRRRAPSTWRRSRSRCSFCRATATSSPSSILLRQVLRHARPAGHPASREGRRPFVQRAEEHGAKRRGRDGGAVRHAGDVGARAPREGVIMAYWILKTEPSDLQHRRSVAAEDRGVGRREEPARAEAPAGHATG